MEKKEKQLSGYIPLLSRALQNVVFKQKCIAYIEK